MNYRKAFSSCFKHKADSSKLAFALFTGLAIGALLSILFAPSSGQETRSNISDKAGRLKNNLKDRIRSARDEPEPVIAEIPGPGKRTRTSKKRES